MPRELKQTEMDTITAASCTSVLELYMQKLKIATAISIIRLTPTEISPEDYTAQLAEQVLQHSDVWMTKSPIVEKLMHCLEQSFCQDSQQSMDLSASISDKLPCSQNKCYDLVPSTSNLHTLPYPIVPSNTFVAFMNSLLYLKNIASSNQPYMDEPDVFHSISESLGKLFRHLRSESGWKMPIEMAEKAIKTVHGLFSLKNKALTGLLVDACLFLVDSLVFDIMNTMEINMFEKQHRFSSLIQIMAQNTSLTIMVLSRLMQEVINFHKSLQTRSTVNIYKLPPVVAVENVYFVFQTIEGIVRNMFKFKHSSVLLLTKEVVEAWHHMIIECTNNTNISLPVFYTYLFQVHSLIIDAFKLYDARNKC